MPNLERLHYLWYPQSHAVVCEWLFVGIWTKMILSVMLSFWNNTLGWFFVVDCILFIQCCIFFIYECVFLSVCSYECIWVEMFCIFAFMSRKSVCVKIFGYFLGEASKGIYQQFPSTKTTFLLWLFFWLFGGGFESLCDITSLVQ